MDYTLHYRSPHLMGLDADYSLSRSYYARGWPTFVVIGPDRVVRFHGFDSDRNLSALRKCLDELAPAATAAPKPVLQNGIAIPAEALASRQGRRDRSPRLAFDKAGRPTVVYYSNREGTNAVYWRRYTEKGQTVGEERLSSPQVESYAADCAFDTNGTLWTVWCGQQKGIYDIFVQPRGEGAPKTEQLTWSTEDAMSPKIAIGPGGVVTVAYYKWATLWGSSRDRNIFARTYDPSRQTWSKEVEISPRQPEVEDHTDPDLVVDRQGQAWVVWSYDYHRQLYKKPVEAEQPTIFAARYSSNTVSAPLLVGATGPLRDAIDLFPSAAIDGRGTLWCAWDCSEPRRCIRIARLTPAGAQFEQVGVCGERQAACSTPELAAAGPDLLLLAWSQRAASGAWRGRVALLKEGRPIGEATLIDTADILFLQAQQAPDGQHWVVYEKADAKGSEIVLRNVSRELGGDRR